MSNFLNISAPKSFPMRPLNKGMILNMPPQIVSPEACLEALNYIITENGPKKRPGYEPYGSLAYDTTIKLAYKFIDIFTFWTTSSGESDRELLLITDGGLYKVGLGGLEEVPWAYDTGTITVDGVDVTGIGTDFLAADIYADDILRCNDKEARILEIPGATSITLDPSSDIDNVAGATYSIQRAFNTDPTHLCDWVVTPDKELIFTDLNAPLVVYKYDQAAGEQLEMYIQSDDYKIMSSTEPEDFVANCITLFQDRLFVGYTIEPTDGIRRQRIRWSKVTNLRDFSESTAYLDLPYTQGAIQRLVPMGNILVVYFSDAIFFGIPTNNPDLPVAFQKVETGNMGLVGQKAVISFINGHFYVSQDDIFYLSSSGPERIGSPVIKRTIKESNFRERIYVAPDIENERIVFGFTKDSEQMEELWSFNYKSKGWSYENISSYMIANPLLSFNLNWADLAGFTWEDLTASYATWDSMSAKENEIRFFIESNGFLRQLSTNSAFDLLPDNAGGTISSSVDTVYITPDIDFKAPDTLKTFIRLSLKLNFDTYPAVNTLFSLHGSTNRGRSWQSLGSLVVRAGDDEGYATFLMTSSHARFRLTCTAEVAPYTLEEIVLKVRSRGAEFTVGTQG